MIAAAFPVHAAPQASSTKQTSRNHLAAAAIATIVLVSFRPFSSGGPAVPGQSSGGDMVNQLGFGLMGMACIWLLAKAVPVASRRAALNVGWIIALPVLALSVYSADSPNSALRAMVFSLIVAMAAFTAIALPRTKDEMVTMLATAIGTALGFCYIAVFFVPEQGVHQASGFEAFHAGLWRGVYDHKNGASYVMGGFAMVGWFVWRNGRPKAGAAIAIGAVVFLVFSGSKTALGAFPAAFMTAVIAGWVTWRPVRGFIVLLPVLALLGATLGAVLYPPILEALRDVVPDLSYTGRTDLWIFGLEYLKPVPWFGYGYESFWNTGRVAGLEQPIELSWDVRGIVHGHSSWLDAAISFGVPGAIVLAIPLVLLPVRDYLVIPREGLPGRLAGLYIGIWILCALGASLESFFFRRSDPVWFLMLIAIAGLRVTAHRTALARSQ